MGYALDKNTVMLGLLLVPAFFLITTYKLFGNLIILMVVVFVLTAIFPPLAALIAGASLIIFLLKIKFLWNNWRALLVGMYAYGVYLLVVLFNNFFYNHAVIRVAGKIIGFFQEGSADKPERRYGNPPVCRERLPEGQAAGGKGGPCSENVIHQKDVPCG